MFIAMFDCEVFFGGQVMFEKIKVKSLAIFNTAVGTPSDVHPWHLTRSWRCLRYYRSAKALSLFSTGRAELKTQLFLMYSCTILLWVWFSIRQLKCSEFLENFQWNLHRGTRGLVVESGEGITQVGKPVELCGNVDEFEMSNSIWILHIEFFVGTWGWKRSFRFFISTKILSYVFRWREAVPVFEGYAIPHAIFKMKAGYTDIQAPKSHSYDGKERIWNLGFRWSGSFQHFQVAGQDITERLKTLMATS